MLQVVCGVLENTVGEYLACLRPAGKHLGGQWEFPGGKVDAGESPTTALARELMEELAVGVEVGEPLTPVIWAYEERVIQLLPFCCRIVSGELRAMEHEELRWCAVEDFAQLEWAAADLPILAEINERLRVK